MKFNREEGLTLIELLITIAVIAIVAAISIPVITNVIDSARTSSAGSMEAQVNAFIDKYSDSGEVVYDEGTQTFTGFVDLNADGSFSTDEVIETFTVDPGQFAVTEANGVYAVATNGVSQSSEVTVFVDSRSLVYGGGSMEGSGSLYVSSDNAEGLATWAEVGTTTGGWSITWEYGNIVYTYSGVVGLFNFDGIQYDRLSIDPDGSHGWGSFPTVGFNFSHYPTSVKIDVEAKTLTVYMN